MKGKCILCNSDIERSPSGFNQYEKTFCSQKCMDLHTFKTRSKITNCIICKADLKPGEGWATPLKKRKDYLCPKGKQFGALRKQRGRIREIKKKLKKWYRIVNNLDRHFTEVNCKQCGVALPAEKIGRSPFCKNSCRALFDYHQKKVDPHFVLSGRMRNLMNKSLRQGKQGISWQQLAGYSVEELKKHIESLFEGGMSWENIGEWHIDHILPVSRFNYNTPLDPDFKKCWSLSNLRPMWAKENIIKSDKIQKPMQPSLTWFDIVLPPKIGRPAKADQQRIRITK